MSEDLVNNDLFLRRNKVAVPCPMTIFSVCSDVSYCLSHRIISSLSLPEGRAAIAYEPSEPLHFFFP
jgi:hypothetical protein